MFGIGIGKDREQATDQPQDFLSDPSLPASEGQINLAAPAHAWHVEHGAMEQPPEPEPVVELPEPPLVPSPPPLAPLQPPIPTTHDLRPATSANPLPLRAGFAPPADLSAEGSAQAGLAAIQAASPVVAPPIVPVSPPPLPASMPSPVSAAWPPQNQSEAGQEPAPPEGKRLSLSWTALVWITIAAIIGGVALSYFGVKSQVLGQKLQQKVAEIRQELSTKVSKEGSRVEGAIVTQAPITLEGTNSSLTVDGSTVLQGPVLLGSSLDVAGLTTLADLAAGNGTFNGNLTVHGIATLDQLQAGAIVGTLSSFSVGGDKFTVAAGTGTTRIKGDLTVEGVAQVLTAITLSGNFSQTGTGSFSTSTGAVSLNGPTTTKSLTVNGGTTVNGNLAVSGTGSFGALLSALGGVSTGGAALNAGSGSLTAGASTLSSLSVSGATTTSGLLSAVGGISTGGAAINAGTGAVSGGAATFSSLGVTGGATIGGTLDVTGATTLGTLQAGSSTLDSLTVTNNATVGSLSVSGNVTTNLVPATAALQLGTAANLWNKVYADEVIANTIVGTSVTGGTSASDFFINTDNATADLEDMSVVFERGTVAPNATLTWNSTADRFEFNQALQGASTITALEGGTGKGFIYAPSTATGQAFRVDVGAEANPRFTIRNDGQIAWGAGGASATDTNLYRSAVDELRTDDRFLAGLPIEASKSVAGRVAIGALGPSSAAGILFGDLSDTNLYRSSAGILKTDGQFNAAGNLVARHDGTNMTIVGAIGPSSESGIKFGLAGDTNLYRQAADTLKTDDSFEVAGASLNVSGATGAITLRGKSLASTPILLARVAGNTSDNFEVRADGSLLWGSGSTSMDTNLYRASANLLQTDDTFFVPSSYVQAASSLALGNAAFRTGVAGDSQHRFQVDNTGRIDWGPGTGAADTNLYRSAANTLKTDDSFAVASNFLAGVGNRVDVMEIPLRLQMTASGTALQVLKGAEAQLRFTLSEVGVASWGDGISAPDTNLYRSAANELKTDDDFASAQDISARRAVANQTIIGARGPGGQAGIAFGDAVTGAIDTNLYRSAADTLRTDDALQALSYTVQGSGAGLTHRAAATSGTSLVVGRVSTDTFDRVSLDADGRLSWGPGNATYDTTLYRATTNLLSTDDSFRAYGTSGVDRYWQIDDARITRGGSSLLATEGASIGLEGPGGQAGIKLGGDTNLYRSDVNTLKTDDILVVAPGGTTETTIKSFAPLSDIDGLLPGSTSGSLIQGPSVLHMVFGLRDNDVNDGFYFLTGGGNWTTDSTYDTVALAIQATGNVGIGEANPANKLQLAASTSSTGGIGFGTDTNLYRSAANTLATDDSLTVSGTLNATTLQQGGVGVVLTSTTAGGDISGTFANLQLGSGVVTTTEIFDGTITSTDIQDGTITNIDLSSSAAIAVSKLAAGTEGQVLTVVGGVPTWTTPIAGVPQNAVIFYNGTSCPSGWTELTGARGRYLVGLNPTFPANLGSAIGTALSNVENRTVGQHNHGITGSPGLNDPGHSHGLRANNFVGGGADTLDRRTDTGEAQNLSTVSAGTGITVNVGTLGTSNSGSVAGTNAPYLQLLVCQKS